MAIEPVTNRPSGEAIGEAMTFFFSEPSADVRYPGQIHAKVLSDEMVWQSSEIERLKEESLGLHQAGCEESERATELEEKSKRLTRLNTNLHIRIGELEAEVSIRNELLRVATEKITGLELRLDQRVSTFADPSHKENR